ncbi:MAG: hypothetical protein A3J12_00320 [Omnitrophica bacterium RIFCSPLOWO2_02_FULL_44_11]|nr:MAG: hypothetical protein A3J12_00320 [Omnitrophica bacterium RIFCSPLOWO2_02_FULL_44_11]
MTQLPLNGNQEKVGAYGFGSADDPLTTTEDETSDVELTHVSDTFLQLKYTGQGSGSYGGVYMNYDLDPTDGVKDSINVKQLFGDELRLVMDSVGGSISEVELELQDITGKSDRVILKGVTGAGQSWTIDPDLFDEVDLTKVMVVSLIVRGVETNAVLNIDWGLFEFNREILPDPLLGAGDVKVIVKDPSPMPGVFATDDGSTMTMPVANEKTIEGVYVGAKDDATGRSFGGIVIPMDDPRTAVNEYGNLNTLFPGGKLVFGLTSPDGSAGTVKLEITDSLGRQDSVTLTGIVNSEKYWGINLSEFDELDLGNVKQIAFVFEGIGTKKLNVDWGNYGFMEVITNDDPLKAVTLLPAGYDGKNVQPYSFANAGNSTATLDQQNPNEMTLTYTGTSAESYGGFYVSYPNDKTTPARESINLDTLYPNGLTIQLDSTDLEYVLLEFTEASNSTNQADWKVSQVYLTGLGSGVKSWTIPVSALKSVIDTTKVMTIAMVVKGVKTDAEVNVKWGEFAFVERVSPDATVKPVTKLPLDYKGRKVVVEGFGSKDDPDTTPSDETGLVNVTHFSETYVRMNYTGLGSGSYGGVYMNYDDPSTTDDPLTPAVENVESINLSALYPAGLTLVLDSPVLTELEFELKDASGASKKVILGGLTAAKQSWTLDLGLFSGLDLAHITTLVLIAKGEVANAELNVDWGTFDIDASITPDASVGVVTQLPLNGNQEKVGAYGFGSADDPLTTTEDETSVVSLNHVSDTFLELTYTGNANGSYGGVYMSYDDPSTKDDPATPGVIENVESINLKALYGDALRLVMDSVGGSISEVEVEVEDADGKKDRVILTGVTSDGKSWTIDPDLFDEVDIAHIKTVSLLVRGIETNAVLKIDWGTFDYDPKVNPDAGAGAVTPIVVDPSPQPGTFYTTGSKMDLKSVTEKTISAEYTGADADAYGGIVLPFDDPRTTPTKEVQNLNTLYPLGYLVLELASPDSSTGTVKLEVMDETGKTDFVYLEGITGIAQRWKVNLNAFDEVDLTKVKQFAFVFEKEGIKKLDINWGNFGFMEIINPDSTPKPITLLPTAYNGKNLEAVSFAKLGGDSTASVYQFSQTELALNYTGTSADSYGGLFILYPDNPATIDDPLTPVVENIESMNLSVLYPNGITFQMSSPNGVSYVALEVKDSDNHVATVNLIGISNQPNTWTITLDRLQNVIDVTKVTTFAFVQKGVNNNSQLDIKWGNFIYTPAVMPDGTMQPITKLPLSYDSNRLDPIAFRSSDGSSITMTKPSQSKLRLTYTGAGANSYGGFYLNYPDNTGTGSREAINLSTQFPGGITIKFNSSSVTQVKFEVTDAAGNRDKVVIGGITAVDQTWTIDPALFDGVNLSQIVNFAIVIEGQKSDAILNVEWGDFPYSPIIPIEPEIEVLRKQLIQEQLVYFFNAAGQPGVGIHPTLHVPYDQIRIADGVPMEFTALTEIGFYLQILGEIAHGDIQNGMTRAQALAEIANVLTSLEMMQNTYGWNGLLHAVYELKDQNGDPNLVPSIYSSVAFGDNANLSQSMAVMAGLLQSLTGLTPAEAATISGLTSRIETFLDEQELGYEALYDPARGLLRAQYFTAEQDFKKLATDNVLYIDMFANEFRSGVAFVVARYGVAADAWNNLHTEVGIYKDRVGGNEIENLVPYDGGAFQIFWPLLWSNEAKKSTMSSALINYLYSSCDFSKYYQIPGFISAVSVPEGGYAGKVGIPDLAMTSDPLLFELGSIYALAAAYAVDPEIVMTWMKAVRSQFADLVNPNYGFVDSLRSSTEKSPVVLAIDQASVILGLIGNGGDFMDLYLQNRGIKTQYDNLYNGINLGIDQTNLDPLGPPEEFPSKTFTLLNNFQSEGTIGESTPTTTAQYGAYTQIIYNNQAGHLNGHFWTIPGSPKDFRGYELMVSYSVRGAVPQALKIELKDDLGQLIGSYPFDFDRLTQNDDGIIKAKINIPWEIAFSRIKEVVAVVEPSGTGPQQPSVYIHQLTFRQFPSTEFALLAPLAPGPQQVVQFAEGTVGQVVSENGGSASVNLSDPADGITFSYDVTAEDAIAGIRVYSTNQTLSLLDPLKPIIFGVKGMTGSKFLLGLEIDENQSAGILLTGMNEALNYYQVTQDVLPVGFDLTKVMNVYLIAINNSQISGSQKGSVYVAAKGIVVPVPVLPQVPLPVDINSLLNYRYLELEKEGRLSFSSVSFPTGFVSFEKLIFGFKANQSLRGLRLEFLNEQGQAVATSYVTGINTEARYYEFLRSLIPNGVDLSLIRKINIIIDATSIEGDLKDLQVEMMVGST